MAFLDPAQSLATCARDSCEDCQVAGRIHCHFRPMHLLHFLTMAMPPFLLGGAGIVVMGGWYLAPWAVMIIGYFGFLEIRVMCSHCPHYAEAGRTLGCWANHGSPRLWKYRPGPMPSVETTLFAGGFAPILGYPLIFLILAGMWYLLLVYLVATAGAYLTLKLHFCSRCMNFACPLNRVDQQTRQAFFHCNPGVAAAWRVKGD
jgi:hypothetical protein